MHDPLVEAKLTRRRVLKLGIAGAAAAGLASGTPAWAKAKGAAKWPTAQLDAAAAKRVAPSQFLGSAQLRSWQTELDGRGLRATGTAAHESYVDALQSRLQRAGVPHVTREADGLRRWTADGCSLDVVDGPSAGTVKTAAYIPYSGQLPAGGATGPLVHVAAGDTVAPGSLAGKIALFDVGIPPFTVGTFLLLADKKYDPQKRIDPNVSYSRSWIGDFTTRLQQLQDGAPAAVIGIIPFDDATSAGSYFPYDGVIRSTPGVYVAQSAGAALKALAGTGTSVRVKLNATVAQVKTHSLLGIIPGASKELVMLHSHTDGPNGIEDNGPDVIIAMAQYLSRLRRRDLPRSILISLASGHFAGGIGTLAFTKRHLHDLVPRVVAAITIEHVGALEWAPQPDGSTKPTGQPEVGAFFGPQNAALLDAAYAGLVAGKAAPAITAHPLAPHPSSSQVAAWPGEGQYLWNSDAAIADANYITGPSYLLNAGIETVSRTDHARVRQGAIGFTQMALQLAATPRSRLKAPVPR
jgi:hypothetical protein